MLIGTFLLSFAAALSVIGPSVFVNVPTIRAWYLYIWNRKFAGAGLKYGTFLLVRGAIVLLFSAVCGMFVASREITDDSSTLYVVTCVMLTLARLSYHMWEYLFFMAELKHSESSFFALAACVFSAGAIITVAWTAAFDGRIACLIMLSIYTLWCMYLMIVSRKWGEKYAKGLKHTESPKTKEKLHQGN